MPSICKFELSKRNEPYYIGECVDGIIKLTTSTEKKIKGISIIFTGGAKVRWRNEEKKRKRFSRTSITSFGDELVAFNCFINKVKNVQEEGVLPAGTYEYPFNFLIPLQGISSMEHKYGHVRYELSLRIDNQDKYDNLFKTPFTVIKTLDLNTNPNFKAPQASGISTTSWSKSLFRGIVHYKLHTLLSGFAPGQILRFTFEIVNTSDEQINGVLIEFVKSVTFTARSPYSSTKRIQTELISKFISEKDIDDDSYCGDFFIPATPPTTSHTNLIFVEYFLRVRTQLSGLHSKPDVELPIIVGTVPIRESIPSSEKLLIQDDLEGYEGLVCHRYELRPPTFESPFRCDSPFIDLDVDERDRINSFKPVYPMYEMRNVKRTLHAKYPKIL